MSHREKVVYIKIFQSSSSGCHSGEGERERAGKKEAKTEECEARERNISPQIILKKMIGMDQQSEGGRHFYILLVGPRERAPSGQCCLFLPDCWEGHCWDSEVPRAHAPVPSTCHFLQLVPGPSEPFLLSLPVLGS